MPDRISSLAASLLLGLTLLLFAIPLAPRMPEAGLDPSFAYALNMAVAQGLRFGHEIIFTLGPYASTYTAMYHPATDHLMLLGGALIGLGYLACSLLLARDRHWLLILSGGLLLAALLSSRDAFLLSYPLVACLALTRLPTAARQDQVLSRVKALIPAALSAPFGLLLLTKGSFAVLCTGLLLLAAGYLCAQGRWRQALLFLASPLAILPLLWLHAGQRLADLPDYFVTQVPIIAGFTEAMSWPGNPWELLLWCASALALLTGLAATRGPRVEKGLVLLAVAFFLFIAFKAGFVRHDMHVIIASDSLLLAAVFLLLRQPSRALALSLVLLPPCWIKLDEQHPHPSPYQHFASLDTVYRGSAEALWSRTVDPQRLPRQYENSLTSLQTRYNFPLLAGRSDIYAVNQAELFASGNTWHPRPVFQSYSAYSPQLARRNARHQASSQAADNLLFRMEPIDQRLPALEDGAAWLPLLEHYAPTRQLEQGYLLLSRRAEPADIPLRWGEAITATLGQAIELPSSDQLVFARIEVRPSAPGRLVSLLYKSSPLNIELELSSGDTRTFRFVAGMAHEPFLLSPAVLETRDFAGLFSAEVHALNKVVGLKITPQHSPALWLSDYSIHFAMAAPPSLDAAPLANPTEPIVLTAARLALLEQVSCEGQVDTLNGQPLGDSTTLKAERLELVGWNTLSGKAGLTPEAVFIGLIDAHGTAALYRTQAQERGDVSAYFAQPALLQPGFSAQLTSPPGRYRLEILRINQGLLQRCATPSHELVLLP